MLKASSSYLQTQVTTTTPGDLLIMLYDACLKNLRQAQERIKERDFKNKGILISKAIDIISELQASLNQQKGGDLAVNLNKLYFYCNTRLLHANMKMDVAILDEVIKIIAGVRDAFYQVVTQQPQAQGQAQAMAAAAPPQPAKSAPAAAPAQAAPAQPMKPYTPAAMTKPAAANPPAGQILHMPAPAAAAQPAVAAQAAAPAPAAPPAMPRLPNQRAFAAYATAHKQSA